MGIFRNKQTGKPVSVLKIRSSRYQKVFLPSIFLSITVAGMIGFLYQVDPAKAVLPAPGGVEGAALWLKADGDLVVNGSNQVQQWNDQSGSGLVINQARAATTDTGTPVPTNNILKVANGVNFNPSVDFAGVSNAALRGSTSVSWNSTANLNMFAVNLTEGQSPGSLSGLFTTNGSWTSTGAVGRGLLANKAGDAYILDGSGCSPGLTAASARTHIARGIYVATNTTTGGSTWLDGTKAVDTGACAQGTGGANFEIGGRTGDTGFENRIFNGKIPEVIVFKSALTNAEAQRIDSYLGIKYGITLNSTSLDYLASDGTTIPWDASDNTGYYNNVFGIGRDDNSALNQKQSKSMNPGSVVTIGNANTIAADNASNPNNFTADKTFMMVGDNGAPTAPSGLLSGTTTNQVRMARAWKVDETNSAGSVKVSIPASSVPGLSPILIRSTDATFTTSDTIVSLVSDGNGNYQADYDFSDGDFFTFAYIGGAPGGVFGLATWQKANDGTASSSSWSDSSGNSNTATQTVVGNQSSYVANGINFNPSLDFSGASKYFNYATSLGIDGLADFSSIAVSSNRDMSSRPIILGSVPATSQYHLQLDIDGNPWVGQGGGGGGCSITNSTAILPLNTPGIISAVRGSNAMSVRLDANASNQGSGTCNSTQFNAPRTLGGRPGSSYVNGLIPEYVQYPRALTDAELQRLDSYLAIKYGTTLPTVDYLDSGGATIWNRTTNASYNNNITSIGRDDLSILNQKQSKSQNVTGPLVAVGNGDTIAADNISNATTFADDKDFLMFGDNNGAINWTMTGAPTNRAKLSRTFKVQNTGSVGSVKLQVPRFNSTASTKLPPETVQVYLLTDADGDFSSGATSTLMTLNGTNFEANSVLAEGTFFTFATDTLPPPHITPATDSGVSDTDGITNFTRPDFTGACAVGQTVTLSIDGTPITPTAICDGTGNYVITPTNPIAEGDHVATAGLPTSGPYNFTIDTTNPAPGTPDMTAATDSGSSDADNITNDNTPAFTGTCIDGQTVILRVDSIDVTPTTVCAGGVYTITVDNPILDGNHAITTIQGVDIAGNTSGASGVLNVTVDTVAPVAPVITSPTTGAITTDNQPTFDGTGEDAATVTVTDENNNVICTAVVSAGTWSCTPTAAIADGAHVFKATQTDVAGNISAPSVTVNIAVDAVTDPTPATPTTPPGTSNNPLADTGMNLFAYVALGILAMTSAAVALIIRRKLQRV